MAPRLLVASLVAALSLAGCIGAEEAPLATDETPGTNESVNENATLPDGRGESAGILETNKTEEGVGGVDHKHDYWDGAEQIVVYDDVISFFPDPVYPDGEGSQPASVVYIKLPQPFLIYEGAATVDVLVGEPTLGDGAPATPLGPALKLSYRTAMDVDFRDFVPITPGTPVTLTVLPKETDMPHSVSSLWAFKIQTDKADAFHSVPVTITVHKGDAILDWPGHPDFYADVDERVVLDASLSVHRQGIEEGLLYGTASSWVRPDRLISYGTGSVDVYINVTSVAASNGAEATGFFLEFHNATILDEEDDFNDRIDDEEGGREFTDPYYHFVVPVEAAGMDGPYQPTSRWGFRPVATFAETPAASLCPGCFAYDIDYTIKIVAHKGEDAARING